MNGYGRYDIDYISESLTQFLLPVGECGQATAQISDRKTTRKFRAYLPNGVWDFDIVDLFPVDCPAVVQACKDALQCFDISFVLNDGPPSGEVEPDERKPQEGGSAVIGALQLTVELFARSLLEEATNPCEQHFPYMVRLLRQCRIFSCTAHNTRLFGVETDRRFTVLEDSLLKYAESADDLREAWRSERLRFASDSTDVPGQLVLWRDITFHSGQEALSCLLSDRQLKGAQWQRVVM